VLELTGARAPAWRPFSAILLGFWELQPAGRFPDGDARDMRIVSAALFADRNSHLQ
jgi:hypothetical protein